ncbi:MAG: putative glycolipid-binding domain-containing protein [Solirubrobacteraceae bacterium]|nr:putative glycolipid-binding domain-containing protein [Solirubrobacteraceae bacterium]
MERTARAGAGGLSWIHEGQRHGTEVAVVARRALVGPEAFEITGTVAAVDEGMPFALRYRIVLDDSGRTRFAVLRCADAASELRVVVSGDGDGHWTVNNVRAPELDGCLDVDLEASLLTNAFPVARLTLPEGEPVDVPAVWIRTTDLRPQVLRQRYRRLGDADDPSPRFGYESPEHAFSCELAFGTDGFVVDYPELGRRSPQAPPGPSPLLRLAAPPISAS